jgi:hypothetical protein
VKNHDFTPKNHIFTNFRGARAGGAPPPTLDPPLLFSLRSGIWSVVNNNKFRSSSIVQFSDVTSGRMVVGVTTLFITKFWISPK